MQQLFVKTIQSNQVEFSRLLYPLRYKISIRVENKNPLLVTLQKNESNTWYINADEPTTVSLTESMKLELIECIKENERSLSAATV